MPTFTHVPEFGASKEVKPNVTKVSFGDGYESRIASGINRQPEIWTLTFANRTTADADAIESFLAARAGQENFDWIPPRQSVARKFVCRQWSRVISSAGFDTISAMFEEVFEV